MPQVEIKNISSEPIVYANENNPEGVEIPAGSAVVLEIDPDIGVELSTLPQGDMFQTPLADDDEDAAA